MARSDSFQKKWASVPSQFERPADALIDRGWAGGAAEDPPEAKWENWWHNRVDEALAEIEANGAMAWFEDVPYSAGASVRSGGKNWIAAIASAGIEPDGVDDLGHWQELSLEIATKAEAEESDEASADNVKRMTPLRVLQAIKAQISSASETVAGMLRIGTQTEVNAGLLDDVAVTPKKLAGLVDFTIIYPNGGSAASPANVSVSSEYPLPNPYPGYAVDVTAEIKVGGQWGAAPLVGVGSATAGVSAYQLDDGDLIVQAGAYLLRPKNLMGSAFPSPTGVATPLPCRVKVSKVKGRLA